MTLLQRILRHPHQAVFDKAPDAATAMRVRHPDGATWSIGDGSMSVTAGALVRTYDLRALTVGQLILALQADGFEVIPGATEFLSRSAMVLVEASGDQFESNGDRVDGFKSLLWSLYSGYTAELREAQYQVGQALRQMIITQASGEWLDLWGALYAEGRRQDEPDVDYAERIPKEAFRVRVNGLAIEQAILDATGEDVRIREPWKQQFILDESALSGSDKLYDGETIGYHLIQPVSSQNIDWTKVLPVVHRNRAAGVLVLDPQTNVGSVTAALIDGTVHFSGHGGHAVLTPYEDRALLDYSDISDVSILNHEARWRREILRTSYSEVDAIYPGPADYVVHAAHGRDYRVVYIDVQYVSQYWTSQRTWASADSTWQEFNVIIDTAHTQSA